MTKKKKALDHGKCPACGSSDIDFQDDGYEDNPSKYFEYTSCNKCGKTFTNSYILESQVIDEEAT